MKRKILDCGRELLPGMKMFECECDMGDYNTPFCHKTMCESCIVVVVPDKWFGLRHNPPKHYCSPACVEGDFL